MVQDVSKTICYIYGFTTDLDSYNYVEKGMVCYLFSFRAQTPLSLSVLSFLFFFFKMFCTAVDHVYQIGYLMAYNLARYLFSYVVISFGHLFIRYWL